MQINLPDVVAEVTAAYNRYNSAIDVGDAGTLNELFHNAPQTLRYGPAENLYGWQAISAFRSTKWSGAKRRLYETIVTTYGRDFAVASTLFDRPDLNGRVGRQMQTWSRFPEGWRIIAAHVSIIDPPKG
jgi:hypothetical protein